jgi:MFS family permease
MSARTVSATYAVDPFRLALFWLGLQAVWGALLGISLQARTVQLAAGNALIAYGDLARDGAFVAACTQVAVGLWSDRRRDRGSRRIEFYIAGSTVAAVALALFYDAKSFAALVGAFVLLQAAMNVAIGPYQAIIPDFVERGRIGIASSWMAALQSAGNALGALCASFINDARLLAGALDAMLLATGAITCLHVRSLAPVRTARRSEARSVGAFVDLFISRAFVYVGFYTLLGYLFFYVSGVLGAASLESARRSSGILILVFTLLGAAGAAAAARPSDRYDKRAIANVGGLIVVAALLLFVFSHQFPLALAATVVAGFGWGIFLVADWAIACRVLPPGSLASTMGIWNLAIVVPQIIAPLLTTAVLVHFGLAGASAGPRSAFVLAAGETLLGILWLWRLPGCVIRE